MMKFNTPLKNTTGVVISLFVEQLLEAEKKCIEILEKREYLNPLEDDDRKRSLILSNGDRRYLSELKELEWHELELNQVRVIQIDKADCLDRIIPSIEKIGLQDPILVEETEREGIYKIVHGHNSAWSMNFLERSIPVLVITSVYNSTGDLSKNRLSELYSRIQGNRVMKNRQLSMDDAVHNIKEAFKVDSTFNGKNPSGKLPLRSSQTCWDWDDLMDEIYLDTGFFLHKMTRTKIRNKFKKNDGGNKLTELKPDNVTAILKHREWDTGLTTKGKVPKRKDTLKHLDLDREAIIALLNSNGDNYISKLMRIIIKYALDPDYRSEIDGYDIKWIDIFYQSWQPSTKIVDLNSEMMGGISKIKKFDNYLKSIDSTLRIRYMIIPKHIDINEDKEKLVDIREEN